MCHTIIYAMSRYYLSIPPNDPACMVSTTDSLNLWYHNLHVKNALKNAPIWSQIHAFAHKSINIVWGFLRFILFVFFSIWNVSFFGNSLICSECVNIGNNRQLFRNSKYSKQYTIVYVCYHGDAKTCTTNQRTEWTERHHLAYCWRRIVHENEEKKNCTICQHRQQASRHAVDF